MAASSLIVVLQVPDVGAGLIKFTVELGALAWRDIEMRRRAFEVLQRLWPGVPFDPFAQEAERLQQVGLLRQSLGRRAG